MRIECLPPEHPLCEVLLPLADSVADSLELPGYLALLTLCLDDLQADERIWLSFGTAQQLVTGGLPLPPQRSLTVYLHPDQLLKDRPLRANLLPTAAVWEMGRSQGVGSIAAAVDVSRPKIERFLYHQFLFIRDLCDGTLDPGRIPRDLAAPFQEAWAVTVDGRLRQARLPGFSAAERRRRFSRFFSTAGVLLPEHWRIFRELWELEDIDQQRLLEMLQRLPTRGGARQ